MRVRPTEEKPRTLRIREAMRPLAEIHDMTSANIRHLQLTDEPEYRPVRIGRWPRSPGRYY